jgi:hypothetical protein
MSPVDNLLARLDGVKATGAGRWIARCPSHEDRSPSLAVAERDDGAVLIHCHAGCSVHEVTSALHMELHELFPPRERDRDNRPRARPLIPHRDILQCLMDEAVLVATAAGNIAQGVDLTDEDRARLMVAAGRINNALEAAHGKR